MPLKFRYKENTRKDGAVADVAKPPGLVCCTFLVAKPLGLERSMFHGVRRGHILEATTALQKIDCARILNL